MKTYSGHRDRKHGHTIVEVDDQPLSLRLDLENHSPTGFEWGYGGSGPAQLALAILADATGNDELACQLHQEFKRAKIAGLRRADAWIMTDAEVLAWVEGAPR